MMTMARHTAVNQRLFGWTFAAVLVGSFATGACAEVKVEGTHASVRITTDQDPVADVLSALAANFNVQIRSAIPLSTAAHPSYTGSVGQVLSSLLDGYNYVIKRGEERTEVVVFGRGGEVAIPPRAPPPVAQGLLSRWR
jgi:hypothetical protein